MNLVPALRVAVAEDEPMNLKRLVRLLKEAGCEVVASFEDGESIRTWLDLQPQVDALFMDIRMPGASGLEVLRSMDLPPPVVFVTAHPEHAVEAFDEAAADYLLKPFTAQRLEKCLTRVRARLAEAPQNHDRTKPKVARFPVKAGEGLVFLDLAKTTYFEVLDEVVWAYAGGKFQTLWKALAEVEAAFPQAGLMRIHRHLLVRPECIVGIKPLWGGRLSITLQGGTELESSRGATARVKERLGVS
jgi:DNA-binding LytR/AlgR family response regulator